MPLATRCELSPAAWRLQNAVASSAPTWQGRPVDVVGNECFGPGLEGMALPRQESAIQLVAMLGLAWARLWFDGASRLRLIGTQAVPEPQARQALGRVLMARTS
jgi:hypothetical protein